MIEICLDCETTGLSKSDDRIVEIGCVEIDNYLPTGRTYHQYINPKKVMPREAERVHGLSDAFLKDKPVFRQILPAFLEFIGDKPLVIHNAAFDMGMLNSELKRLGKPDLKNPVTDTMAVSRKVRPGKSHKLDAICRDYKIDLSRRTLHGALLDAEILASAYLALSGGEQYGLSNLEGGGLRSQVPGGALSALEPIPVRSFRPRISDRELLRHANFVKALGEKSLWLSYEPYAMEDDSIGS